METTITGCWGFQESGALVASSYSEDYTALGSFYNLGTDLWKLPHICRHGMNCNQGKNHVPARHRAASSIHQKDLLFRV